MQFRRIYWVTEQLGADGTSEIGGVYTSIQDLIDEGLRWNEGSDKKSGFRISLVKLDAKGRPLGTWMGPDFAGLEEDLEAYVKTKEFDYVDCIAMVQELKKFAGAPA